MSTPICIVCRRESNNHAPECNKERALRLIERRRDGREVERQTYLARLGRDV